MLAKFNKSADGWNSARVEHAMLILARLAEITAAESRIVTVGEHEVLLVKRFDRDNVAGGYTRARSAPMTLAGRIPRLTVSYIFGLILPALAYCHSQAQSSNVA